MEDETDIFEEPKEIKEQEEHAKREAMRLSAFVTGTMGTRNGRDFVWHLLDRFGVYRSSFSANSNKMARNVGAQEAGQYLMQLILMECPGEYERMFAEHRYKEEQEKENVK